MYPRMWALCPPVSPDRSPSSSLCTYSHHNHVDCKPVRSPVAPPLLQHHFLRNPESFSSNGSVCSFLYVQVVRRAMRKSADMVPYNHKRSNVVSVWISSNCDSQSPGFLETRPYGPAGWNILDGHSHNGWRHQLCLLLVCNDLLWEASLTAKRCCNTKTTTLQTGGPPPPLPARTFPFRSSLIWVEGFPVRKRRTQQLHLRDKSKSGKRKE